MDQNIPSPEGNKGERPTYTAPGLQTFSEEELRRMFPEVFASTISLR